MAVRKSASRTKRKSSNGKQAAARTTTTPKKLPNFRDPLSKSGIIKAITDYTALSRKDVVSVLDGFAQIIEKHVKSGGPGTFVMPGMLKINVVKKAARPARKGINPFTGEEIMIKAKPAYRAVKIRALKKLKQMVA
jgi:nucleoid DNA-binding protein